MIQRALRHHKCYQSSRRHFSSAEADPLPKPNLDPPAAGPPSPPETEPLHPDALAAIATAAASAAALAVESRLAPLVEAEIIQLDGPPPRGRISGMRLGSDDVSQAVEWLFGAPGAVTPAPRLRDSAELYRLLTGDVEWRGIFQPSEALATANVTTLADPSIVETLIETHKELAGSS